MESFNYMEIVLENCEEIKVRKEDVKTFEVDDCMNIRLCLKQSANKIENNVTNMLNCTTLPFERILKHQDITQIHLDDKKHYFPPYEEKNGLWYGENIYQTSKMVGDNLYITIHKTEEL